MQKEWRTRVSLCMLSVAIVMLTTLPLSAAERVLTLEDSLNAGLHNNQELLALKEQISIAQQRISEARSLVFPKIDLNLSASQFDNDTPIVLAPSFNSMFLPAEKRDVYYSTRFSLWQYLYAGGRYTTTLRLAEINLSEAQSQADAARSKVILDTKQSFYACIATKEKIKSYETVLAEIKDLTERNPAARNEWLRGDRKYRFELLELRHEYEKQKLRFLKTTGLELNTDIELEGTLSVVPGDYDLNKCLAWAFQFRPELRQTQFQQTMDSLRVNLSLTERIPTVTLGANYEWLGDRLPLNTSNWNATVNINLPVFDGWASWARIRQRRLQAREGKIRRSQIEDQIRYEVRESFSDYLFWQNQFSVLMSQPFQETDPARKLEAALEKIDTAFKVLSSQITLDWAIGKPFFK